MERGKLITWRWADRRSGQKIKEEILLNLSGSVERCHGTEEAGIINCGGTGISRAKPDGTPDEVKVSCPVWSGGKTGGDKGLPIAIRSMFYLYFITWITGGGSTGGRGYSRPNERWIRH